MQLKVAGNNEWMNKEFHLMFIVACDDVSLKRCTSDEFRWCHGWTQLLQSNCRIYPVDGLFGFAHVSDAIAVAGRWSRWTTAEALRRLFVHHWLSINFHSSGRRRSEAWTRRTDEDSSCFYYYLLPMKRKEKKRRNYEPITKSSIV